MTRTSGLVCACAIAIAIGGCGGGGFDSGIDEGKPFNELTDAEARTACENLAGYVRRQLPLNEQYEVSCTIMALGSTTSPDACRAAVTTCLAGDPDPILGEIDCSMAMADSTCGASVGQVEDCIGADVDAYVARLDQVRCDIAGNLPELERLQQPIPVPAQCSSLSMCPEYQDGIIGR